MNRRGFIGSVAALLFGAKQLETNGSTLAWATASDIWDFNPSDIKKYGTFEDCYIIDMPLPIVHRDFSVGQPLVCSWPDT